MASSQNQDPAASNSVSKHKIAQIKSQKGSVMGRLRSDLKTVMADCFKEGVTAFPSGDNFFEWTATIIGPADTVYEGLRYKLLMKFPSGYPIEPPKVTFTTPIYHPNVDEKTGEICLDILKEKWMPSLDAWKVLLSIRSLLGDPNNDSPLNIHAAEKWADQEQYKATLLEKYKKDVADKEM